MSLPTASKSAVTLRWPGRRFAWPFSPVEGALAFVIGCAVWRLLDWNLFPSGMYGNYLKRDIFAWTCPFLCNICALSAICFWRALRGGTVNVSPAAYAAMAFPVAQTLIYLVASALPPSPANPTAPFFVLAVLISLPMHFLVSAVVSERGGGPQVRKGNRAAMWTCIGWYAFLIALAFGLVAIRTARGTNYVNKAGAAWFAPGVSVATQV